MLATTWDMYDTYESIGEVRVEESQGCCLGNFIVFYLSLCYCEQRMQQVT